MKKCCNKCGRLTFSVKMNDNGVCDDCVQKSKWDLPKNVFGYFLENVGIGFFGLLFILAIAIMIAFAGGLLYVVFLILRWMGVITLFIVGGLIGILSLLFIIGVIIKKWFPSFVNE